MKQRLGPAYSPQLFNIATDLLINETLLAVQYDLPEEGVRLKRSTSGLLAGIGVRDLLAGYDAESLYMKLFYVSENDTGFRDALTEAIENLPIDIWPDGVLSDEDLIENAE